MYIWGKGRADGRVGSDFLSAIAGWVGSGRVNVSPGRVGSKKSDVSDPWTTLRDPSDHSMNDIIIIHLLVTVLDSSSEPASSQARRFLHAAGLFENTDIWRWISYRRKISGISWTWIRAYLFICPILLLLELVYESVEAVEPRWDVWATTRPRVFWTRLEVS